MLLRVTACRLKRPSFWPSCRHCDIDAAVLGAIVGLLAVMLRVSERQRDHERLPEGNGKRALLRAIDRASKAVPLRVALCRVVVALIGAERVE